MLLSENGRSCAPIVIDPAATMVEEFAADELRAYLGRITGARFSVLYSTAPEGPALVIANAASELGREVCPEGAPTESESYIVRVSGDRILLLGADDRGTLYAVYSFLEKDCGVAWLAPSVGQEVVPNQPVLAFADREYRDQPVWPIRVLSAIPKMVSNVEIFKQYIDFAAKVRINYFLLFAGHFYGGGTQTAEPWDDVRAELLPEFQKRGISLDIGHHCWDYFLDPKIYFAEHPEWFSLIDGKRVPNRQLCLASDEVLQEFERNVRSYLRSHPEISIMSLFPNDIGGIFCQCEHCRQVEPEEAALGAILRIASNLRSELPNVRFAHLTYDAWGALTPSRAKPSPNVILYWAAWARCLAHGYYSTQCDINRGIRISLDAWRQRWPNPIIVYDYYTTTNHSTNTLLPFACTIAEDARTLRAAGFEGLMTTYTQVDTWWTYALNLWLFGKLTWNPERDPDSLLTEWVGRAYPTTAPQVRQVYRLLEQIGGYEANYYRSDITRRLLYPAPGHATHGSVEELSEILETLDRCQAMVEVARAREMRTRSALEEDYLRRLSIALRYGSARYRYLRGIVGALTALKNAERAPSAEDRTGACRTAMSWIAQVRAATDDAVSLLDRLGDGVAGILNPVYVRNWARALPSWQIEASRVLEDRVRAIEAGVARG